MQFGRCLDGRSQRQAGDGGRNISLLSMHLDRRPQPTPARAAQELRPQPDVTPAANAADETVVAKG